MVSAPIAVVLYDRAFRAESWRALFKSSRRSFYVALFGDTHSARNDGRRRRTGRQRRIQPRHCLVRLSL